MSNFQFYTKLILCFLVVAFSIWYLIDYKSLCGEFEALNYSIQLESPKHTPKAEILMNKGTIREVSAYSELDTCPNRPCIMASGQKAFIGAVACPRKYPLGTKIRINGLEGYQCLDRLSLKYDDRIDIFMGYGQEGLGRAKSFGIKILEVEILK